MRIFKCSPSYYPFQRYYNVVIIVEMCGQEQHILYYLNDDNAKTYVHYKRNINRNMRIMPLV
jgi:hypothetical protein